MLEVEIKLPVRREDPVEKRLAALGFQITRVIREEDQYFDNAMHRLRDGNEALRIRTITDRECGHSETVVTFKGKKTGSAAKIRRELKTSLADGDVFRQILEALGFHPDMI